MPGRARLIKPDFYEDEKLTAMPFGARILWSALWCLADAEGLQEDRPSRIASFAFPPMGDERLQAQARKQVSQWLDAFVTAGMLIRYAATGESYLAIKQWQKHQKIHPHEPRSTIPPPLVTNGYQRNTKETGDEGINEVVVGSGIEEKGIEA